MATLTINHYVNIANSFITDIRDNRNGYYMFAARPQPWANSSGGNDDTAVLETNNSVFQTEQVIYDDLLFGKLLVDGDVNHVIPRYNWAANTVYDVYDQDDADLYSKTFYVVTNSLEVYKCIDNNGGSQSTVKPSLTSTSGTFRTGDGYVWKYMYTIDSTSNSKFTTTDYVPVITNTAVQGNATPGSIDTLRITDGGNSYVVYETGYIGGIINKFTIQLPNTASSVDNYYAKSSIYLKSGFGSGQIREIASSNGVSKQITVANQLSTFARLDLANVAGTVTTGYFVDQTYDSINYLYAQGYYNPGITVTQSDTGTSGEVLASNSSVIQVARFLPDQLFQTGFPIVDVSQSGALKPGTVSVGNTGACNLAIIVSAGSGYTGNTTVMITANGSGSGATANAQANSSGKIVAVNISNTGSGYFVAPSLAIAAPTAQTFNANTAVTGGSGAGSNNIIALATAGAFVANDLITYTVAAGNTAIGGLISGTTYYVDFANSTAVALKISPAGSRIALTKGATETGHTLRGQTATAVMFCDNQLVYGTNTQLTSTANGYSNNEYIRIGANTTNNIRRVQNAVNNTLVIVDTPFSTTFNATANLHYNMPVVAQPVSIIVNGANGFISNTNLTSVEIAISTNSFITGTYFTVGEKVDMTNSARVNQGANGTVAFANSSTVILSGVAGTWLANSGGTQFFVSGQSSVQLSQITSITTNPNITLSDPVGSFRVGYPVFFRLQPGSPNSGNATLVAKMTLPNDQTEYQIGPTVTVQGDGINCVAIAVVNTAPNSNYEVVGVDIINPGFGFTQANVSIYANTNYGSGATARAIVSPVYGHGYDAVTELGGRYVGVNAKFDILANENYEILGHGKYRKIGILENPQFRDIRVTLTNFDRVNLSLNVSSYSTTAGGWTPGEVVVQSNTNAAGVVVFGNSSFLQLKSVKGTFNPSNTVLSYFSNSTANVASANVLYFPVGNAAAIVTQSNSGARGVITQVVNNSVYFMSNVVGQFADGDIIYDNIVNAYATVDSIFTANGTKDSSANFGNRFNQTARITLTSNTGAFQQFEYVVQQVSQAKGRVIDTSNEKDIAIAFVNGSFSVGQTITDQTTNANGICTFANTTYLKLTNVSQNLSFQSTINNGLGATATVANVFPVLILNDVFDATNFQAGSNAIIGQISGASGLCSSHLLIDQPDLVRDSGKVIYTESFAPVQRSAGTKEEVKLVIKF